MKKSIILTSLVSLILGSSFTSKLITRGTLGIIATTVVSNDVKSQNITTYSDPNTRKYHWLITNPSGPVNPTVCVSIMEVNAKTMWFREDSMLYINMMSHNDPMPSHHKIFSINANGKLCATNWTDVNLPFSQVTGTSDILHSQDTSVATDGNAAIMYVGKANSAIADLNSKIDLKLNSTDTSGLRHDLNNKLYTSNFTWSGLSGKPSFATVATTGLYSDLTGSPTNLSQFTNDAGFITSFSETDPLFNTKFSGKSTTDLTEGSNQYFTTTRARAASSAGTGISYNSGVITNTSPDQVVSITAVGGNTVSGTYPNFTITRKKQETYSGTTNGSGNYSVTFPVAYSVAPNIQVCLINPNVRDTPVPVVSTTGFTINVQRRTDVIGLLPSYANVNGAGVDILITEK